MKSFWGTEIRLIEVAFVLAMMLLVRLPYLNVPFERDEGGYAYGAQIMQSGGVPYRDTFEHKGPLLFFVYRAAFAVFGETIPAIHLTLDLWLLLSAFLIYVLASRLVNHTAGFFSSLTFTFLSFKPILGIGTPALTEIFMVLPIALGAFLLLRGIETKNKGLFFFSGFALGAACMTKQTAGLETVFFLICGAACLYRASEDKRAIIPALLLFTLGWAVMPCLFFTYFLLHGAASDFIYFVFLYNIRYPALNPASDVAAQIDLLLSILKLMFRSDFVFVAAFISGIAFLSQRTFRRALLFLSGWFVLSAGALFPGLRFFPHYFHQLYLPFSLIAGIGICSWHAFLQRALAAKRIAPERLSVYLAIVLALVIMLVPVTVYSDLLTSSPEALAKRNYLHQPFVESLAIAAYINKETLPRDTCYVFGSEPQIYFYAQRKSSSRFIFLYPLWERFPGVLEMQQKAFAEVRQARPRFIVFVESNGSHLRSGNSERHLLDETRKLLQEHYALDSIVLMYANGTQYFWGKKQVANLFINGKLEIPHSSCPIYLFRSNDPPQS
jgi:4-amino-4-deoxy-L-arabinose transferase-like glycosyltransferase